MHTSDFLRLKFSLLFFDKLDRGCFVDSRISVEFGNEQLWTSHIRVHIYCVKNNEGTFSIAYKRNFLFIL